MFWQGIVTLVITLSLCAAIIVCHKWIKKITNNYFFWLGISLAFLALLLTRLIPQCIFLSQNWTALWKDRAEHVPGKLFAMVFNTELCFLFSFIVPISLIADPSRRAARAIAPIASLSAMMVLIIVVPFFGVRDFTNLGTFITLGLKSEVIVANHKLIYYDYYYLYHLITLLMCIGVWLNTPRHGWKGVIYTYGVLAIVYVYIIIIKFSLDLTRYVAGVSQWDVIDPEGHFKMCGDICGGNGPAAQALFFTILIVMTFIWTGLQDFVFKRGWFMYGNKSSGVWYKYWDYDHYLPNTNKKDWGKLGVLLPKVR